MNNPSFTVREQLGYAGGIFGNCMGQDSVGTFSNKFFRNFMGIDSARITIMENIHYIINFAVNPVIGNILDRPAKDLKNTPTKKILKFSPIPFALTSMLLFVVPSSYAKINFLWALILKLIFSVTDAFYDMSLNAMSLRMTDNERDRKNFYTVSTFASSLGSMLPGWLIPIIVSRTDNVVMQKWLYFFIALFFCILGVASMYAPYFTLNEKIPMSVKSEEGSISWDRDTLRALLHNRTFIIIQLGNFFEQIRKCSYELLVYLYDDVFDDYSMKAVIDVISGTLSYAGLAFVPFITSKISPRSVMSLGYGFTGFFYTVMGLIGAKNGLFGKEFNLVKIRKYRYLIGICIGLAGMPNNALSASKKVVTGDSTDYMEWYSEKHYGRPIRSEGLICAFQGVCTQIFSLIVTNIYNPLFNTIGYKSEIVTGSTAKKVTQSNKTLQGLYKMFALFGIIGNLLAALMYQFDNYTGKRREDILLELTQMRQGRENGEKFEEDI